MTAAYRFRGIGWMAVLVGFVLAFYLVSLRVAAERKKLDEVTARIEGAQRDIRALETEFDTRANLAQLEKWNGDTLALAAPAATQFVRDDAMLASLDPNAAVGPAVRTAALVVPAAPMALAPQVPAPAPAAAAAPRLIQAAAFVTTTPKITQTAAEVVAPTGRAAPMLARLAEAERGAAAEAKVRPQAVAMLDRKLLSNSTFGDLLSGARAEARRR